MTLLKRMEQILELNPNTGNVTNMEDLFSGSKSLKSIPVINTQNVTDMSGMFSECAKLSSVPVLSIRKICLVVFYFMMEREFLY